MSPAQSSFRLEAILTSWICLQSEHVFARYAFLISSQTSFRLVTVFDSWICLKSDHVFASERFF